MKNREKKRDGRGISNKDQYAYDYSGNKRTYQDGRGRTGHRAIVRLVKVIDVILVSIPFYAAWIIYYSHMVYITGFYRRGNWVVMGLFTFLYYMLAHLYSGFTIHISRISEIVYAQSLGTLVADGLIYIIMWLTPFLWQKRKSSRPAASAFMRQAGPIPAANFCSTIMAAS